MRRNGWLHTIALAVGFWFVTVQAALAEYPTKPIEVVVHTGPGSGSDIFARLVVKAINDQKTLSQPLVVVNKPGGRGAIAVSYLASKRGDAHTIMNMADSGFLNVPIMSGLDYTLDDFTPLAILGFDVNVVAVTSDSPYQSLKELVDAAKADPRSLAVGVGTIGSSAHILCYLVSDDTFNFIGFKGGGEALTSFLGGHVQVSCENLSELVSYANANKVRILAIGSAQRMSILPDVPTAKEQGFDHQIGLGRGFVAPGDFPDEARDAIIAAIKEARNSEDWQTYVSENAFQDNYIDGDALVPFLTEKQKVYHSFIRKFGLDKK